MSVERQPKVKEICFVWKVEKLFSIFEYDDSICSPNISIGFQQTIQFVLSRVDKKILLNFTNNHGLNMTFSNLDVAFEGSKPVKFTRTRNDSFSWLMESNDFCSPVKAKNLSNYSILLKCHLFFGLPTGQLTEVSKSEKLDLLKLSRDLEKLYDSSTFSDLTFFSGGCQVKVHQSILSARSPQLIQELAEGYLNQEISPSAMKLALGYLYTGKVNFDSFLPFDTVEMIEKFKIGRLQEKFFAFPNEVKALTYVSENRYSVIWPIKPFSFLTLPNPKLTKIGPLLCSNFSEKCQMEMSLEMSKHPEFENHSILNDFEAFIEISVRWNLNCILDKWFVKGKTSVVDVFGELQHSKSYKELIVVPNSDNHMSEWKLVWKIGKNIFDQDKDILLPDDTLSLMFDFTIYRQCDKITETAYSNDSFESITFGVDDLMELSADLEKLYTSKEYSDAVLCSENHKVKVHKAIIWARAPKVLGDISRNAAYTRSLDSIPVTDTNPDVLETLLKYIYTGKLPDLNCSLAMKLYLAAYNYEIPLLKKKCLQYIKENLTF